MGDDVRQASEKTARQVMPAAVLLRLAPLLIGSASAIAAWTACEPKDGHCLIAALRWFLIPHLIWKTAGVGIGVLKGRIPALRLAFPLLILVEVALVGAHFVSRTVGMISLGLLDVAVVAFAVWACMAIRSSMRSEHPEQTLERSLLRFFPQAFSRVVAIELTIVASAFGAFKHIWNNQSYDATTYLENAKLRFLVLALPIMLVPDIILVHLVLPGNVPIAKVVLDALGVYGCLWILGIFATMAARPHEISVDSVRLHRGILNTVEFARQSLESATPLPERRRFNRIGKAESEAHLTVRGVRAVEILLREPGRMDQIFGPARERVRRVIVASDQPDELCRRLTERQVKVV